jgi:hypothetical protein
MEIVNVKPMKGSNWLLTPYTTDEGTILISCDYKEEYNSACTGYRNNLSIVDGYNRTVIPVKKPQARYTTTTIESYNFLTIASSDCLQEIYSTTIFKYKTNIFKFMVNCLFLS